MEAVRNAIPSGDDQRSGRRLSALGRSGAAFELFLQAAAFGLAKRVPVDVGWIDLFGLLGR
ncbi:hypothetical protein DF186_18685, partial [Enterococcus hirae]